MQSMGENENTNLTKLFIHDANEGFTAKTDPL